MNKTLSLTLIAIMIFLVSCKWKCEPNKPPVNVEYLNTEVLHTLMGYPQGSYFVYKNRKDNSNDTIYCLGYEKTFNYIYTDDNCESWKKVLSKTIYYYNTRFETANFPNSFFSIGFSTDRYDSKETMLKSGNYSLDTIYCPATQASENALVNGLGAGTKIYYKYDLGIIAYTDTFNNNLELISYYIKP